MNNLTIAVMVAEILFLCLVIVFSLLVMARKHNKTYKNTLKSLRQDVAEHVRQIQRLKRELVAAKLARNAKKEKQGESKGEDLDHYRARIANLEKFKDLFFALEDKLASGANAVRLDAKADDDFQEIIFSQSQEINKLRGDLQKYAAELIDKDKLSEGVSSSIAVIEHSVEELNRKLAHAKRQRALAEKEVEELQVFKAQAKDVQVLEARLKESYAEKERELTELRANSLKLNPHGVVRIKEIEDLSKKLQEKDSDIRRLRQECETIGKQYEELATRSFTLLGENDDLTDGQKEELEELKRRLDESSHALGLKQAECDLLENYYLELESGLESEAAGASFAGALNSLGSLELERERVVAEMTPILEASTAAELLLVKDQLAELECQLAAKESELNEVRSEYADIKQQFIEVAQEDASLRSENQQLLDERGLLRQEISELRQLLVELKQQEDELKVLKNEYSKMEGRYLAMIEKHKE